MFLIINKDVMSLYLLILLHGTLILSLAPWGMRGEGGGRKITNGLELSKKPLHYRRIFIIRIIVFFFIKLVVLPSIYVIGNRI